MQTYMMIFQKYGQEDNTFDMEEMVFQADDEMHAINQLLDYFRTTNLHVAVIESITIIPPTPADSE